MTEENKEDAIFVNEAGTSNDIGVEDEIGVDMLKRNLGAVLNELNAYREAEEQSRKSYDNYKEQWDIDKRLLELQQEHFGMLPEKYTHKIQTIPEFWELEKKKNQFVVRQETHSAEQRLKGFKEDLDNVLERIQILSSEVITLTEKLESLGETVDYEKLEAEFK